MTIATRLAKRLALTGVFATGLCACSVLLSWGDYAGGPGCADGDRCSTPTVDGGPETTPEDTGPEATEDGNPGKPDASLDAGSDAIDSPATSADAPQEATVTTCVTFTNCKPLQACSNQVCTSDCSGGLECNFGCCDSTGLCVNGQSNDLACGVGTSQCMACTGTEHCEAGACH